MDKHIRSHNSFSLNEKLTIIKAAEGGNWQSSMCNSFNLSKSTISNICVNRWKIKHKNGKKKKLRSSVHPKINVIHTVKQQRANNIPVSCAMLQLQAQEFGKLSGDFMCSSGWLDRFKNGMQ